MTKQFTEQYKAGQQLALLLLLCVLAMLLQSGQAIASPLYTAEVSAEQSRQQWQREAFDQVIRRISADPDVLSHPAVQQERQRANTYVKQFEAIRTEQGPAVRVMMDQQKIQQLFREQQLLIWDSRRPQSLIWLVQQDRQGRQFVRQRQHDLVLAIQQRAQQRMIPLIWPLYDMEDLLNLTETDVWAGFWQQIRSASSRYQPDLVVTMQLSEQQSEDNLEYQLFWQLDQQGRVERFELAGSNATQLASDFVDALADLLAQRFAVRYLTESAPLELMVTGASDWADWVRLQRLLSSFPGVGQVDLIKRSGDWSKLRLQLSIPLDEWLQLVALEPALSLLTSGEANQPISLLTPVSAGVDAIQLRFERP
ncbi:DUF2066 domain-containing protein [Alkalimonas amylolytica]|uniref:DUF2066 domain-containing protein n=1 Tax=Alkalimonas amylolytica TaxID=152573 RepID=A0A1H4B0E7_ALKAM|nr:DUF2066 domain-containing protein [Alkalimonas amylolytica]SEA41613.1 hypothetical protein SAMN04488051_103115 [Alkalimonas amylolytica]